MSFVPRFAKKRDVRPWYIERLWRRQYYAGDGHGGVREYMSGSYIGPYPVSRHIQDVLDIMPIDWKVRTRA